MNLSKYIIGFVALLTFGIVLTTNSVSAEAYASYKSVPRAIRGYYISESANDSLKITQHAVTDGSPLADSYFYRVTKVNYSRHVYHIHSYIDLGGRSYFTLRVTHYAKNKLKSGSAYFHKVSYARYHYFLNHWNPEYDYDD